MALRSNGPSLSLSPRRNGDVTANQRSSAGVRGRDPVRLHWAAPVSLAYTRLHVRVASLGGEPVTPDRLTFSNLDDLAAIESCDVLLVPGGGGCLAAIENDVFVKEIARLGATARYLTSVCTGSLILGAAGFLRGRRAACHWAWRELLPVFGAIVDEGRIVRDRHHLSGGGGTGSRDFVLALIAELRGPRAAEMIQLGLEYAPEPPFNSGRPDTAPAEVLEAVNARTATSRAQRRVRLDAWAAAHYAAHHA